MPLGKLLLRLHRVEQGCQAPLGPHSAARKRPPQAGPPRKWAEGQLSEGATGRTRAHPERWSLQQCPGPGHLPLSSMPFLHLPPTLHC